MRYAILLLVLAGCATPTPEERAAQFEARLERLIKTYGPSCDKAYKNGTKEWGECVVMLAREDDMRTAQQRAYWGAAIRDMGDAMQRQPQIQTRCRHDYATGGIRCTTGP